MLWKSSKLNYLCELQIYNIRFKLLKIIRQNFGRFTFPHKINIVIGNIYCTNVFKINTLKVNKLLKTINPLWQQTFKINFVETF